MAEGAEQASKTEEPTPHKLAEARKKGDVARTQDLPSWAVLAAVTGLILSLGGWFAQALGASLRPFVERPHAMALDGGGAMAVLKAGALAASGPTVAVLLTAALAGVGASLLQGGFVASAEKLKPDFKKLNPVEGLKRLFGLDAMVQFAKSLLKVGLLAAVVWMVLKPHGAELMRTAALPPLAMLVLSMGLLKSVFLAVLGITAVIAGADWLWQRQRFLQKMRMSREEVKEEHKQQEGDPHVKAKLKQKRMELSRRRMMQAVPSATVVVMNPTHYAVALRYEQEQDAAPVCVAKGVDAVALKIRAIAEENGVEVVEDPPLARALFAVVEIDETIPKAHYEAVAKIIGFVLGKRTQRPAPARAMR